MKTIIAANRKMILIEIFSGTGSVGKPWIEAGHEVISIDIDGRFGATIVADILEFDYTTLPIPTVIWCSVPCEQYSRARTRAMTPRNFELADSLAAKAWEIIQYFLEKNPELLWFIENGDSTLLWGRKVASEFTPYVRLDYCCYGTLYRKRTRISTNATWTPRPLCDRKVCHACVDGKHVMSAQRGPSKGNDYKTDRCSLDQLHALPRELTEEILEICA